MAYFPIPSLSTYETNMSTYATFHGDLYRNVTYNSDDYTQYDAAQVYYNIKAYTGLTTWDDVIPLAHGLMRNYALSTTPDGSIASWYMHSQSYVTNYAATSEADDVTACRGQADNASYAPCNTDIAWTASEEKSREVAHLVMCYLDAQTLGWTMCANGRYATLVGQMLTHMSNWVNGTYDPPLKPFMCGITMRALIKVYDYDGNTSVLASVRAMCDWLWTNAWLSTSFYYESTNPTNAAPDLNLMIATAYSWVYKMTGVSSYRTIGDIIFSNGVLYAFIGAGASKAFNQNYVWSPSYITYRNQARTAWEAPHQQPRAMRSGRAR